MTLEELSGQVQDYMLQITEPVSYTHLDVYKRQRQYSELVAIVRDYLEKGMDKEEAMRKAWEEGMKRGLLTDILSRNGTEVIAMLLKEYDLEEAKEYWKKEAAEEATKEATSRTLARDRILFDLLLTQERYEEAKSCLLYTSRCV